jgi:putative peptide zinc metalloprotease protein
MTDTFSSQEWYRVAGAKPKLRSDVEVRRHLYLERPWYIISDATGGKVHRLTPAAYAIVGRMDGHHSLKEIYQLALEEHKEDAPSQDDIVRLLTQLHQGDLLTNDERPLLDDLLERRDKDRKQFWKKLLFNPLSATVPLVDPNRFLTHLVSMMRFLPSGIWWLLALAVMLPAAFMVPLNWQALTERGLEGFLDLENLALLAIIYPIVKAIHEIGHGVTIRSRGGEVHEMGFMFIAFYPIPYVEASSSMSFPSKWARAAVAASGVVVELVIAALAFYIWLLAEPGLVRSLAYNTMLIAGISTVIVNGNPLLRFDGYHVLADLIEIPNLGKRGNAWWGEICRVYLFGTLERDRIPTTKWEKFWFFIYPPAAFIYRIFISLTIALFVATTYLVIGIILAIWSLILSLIWPMMKVLHKAFTDPRIQMVGKRAAIAGFGSLALIVLLLFLIPAPHRSVEEAVVWLPREAFVRAGNDGIVQSISIEHQDKVRQGDRILELDAPEQQSALAQRQARVQQIRASFAEAQFSDRARSFALLQELEDAQRSEKLLSERVDALIVFAGSEGILNMPEARNLVGRFVREGEVLGYILPDGEPVLRMVVRQETVELVRDHLQNISVRFANDIGTLYEGSIVREVPAGETQLPSPVFSLDGGGAFATMPSENNQLQTVSGIFQFDIALNSSAPAQLPYGLRAFVRLDYKSMPLGFQLLRQVRILFLSVFDV